MIIIVSKISHCQEDVIEKDLYTYTKEAEDKAFVKFRKEVRKLLVNIAETILDDSVRINPSKCTNEELVEFIQNEGDVITYTKDSFLGYSKLDGTYDVEIDLEVYMPIGK